MWSSKLSSKMKLVKMIGQKRPIPHPVNQIAKTTMNEELITLTDEEISEVE